MNDLKPYSGRVFCALACTLAAFAAVIGCGAMLAWVMSAPHLSALGQQFIPMAPSTGLMFVAFGIAVILAAREPAGRSSRRIAVVTVSAGALAALLLLFLSLRGIRLPAEHLGLPVVHQPGAIPIGHMSPATAACFLLAALSFIGTGLSRPARSLLSPTGFGAAFLLLLISLVLLLAYFFGTPLLYGERMIPPALSTSLAFFALSGALLILSLQGVRRTRPQDEWLDRRAMAALVAVFVTLGTGLVCVGYFYLRGYESTYRNEVERQLTSITDLKSAEIVQWREERLGDGAMFFDNPNFAGLVRSILRAPDDAEARERLMVWMEKLRMAYRYDRITLYDANGICRVESPVAARPADRVRADWAGEAVAPAGIVFRDLYRHNHDGRLYMSVLVPIAGETSGRAAAAILEMRINPAQYLFPLLRRWPVPSKTAETLIVRRDGDYVQFLNHLRFNDSAALKLRIPLSNTGAPAVQAVLGREGIVDGIDYRGVAVTSDVRGIPDSPWFLVARVDTEETLVPLRARTRQVAVLVGAMLAVAGIGLTLLFRQRETRFYRQRLAVSEALRRSETELERKAQELEQIVYVTSHDLRSPLVNVQGFSKELSYSISEMMSVLGEKWLSEDATGRRASIVKEEIPRSLSYIQSSIDKMDAMLSGLLKLSRLGRGALSVAVLDMNRLVRDVFKDFEYVCGRKGAGLRIDGALPPCRGDAVQVGQVFSNLVDNALKYLDPSRPGAIVVTGAREGENAVYCIRDNGVGMAPGQCEKVFEMFYRLNPRAESGGEGIGLTIARRSLERQNGQIRAESEPGVGSRFFVSLPAP